MNVENIVPMRLPPPSMRPRSEPHVTVLRDQSVGALEPHEGGLYVDVTLGAGGHAEGILEVPGTRVIGLDRDAGALALASARLERFGDRVRFLHGRFGAVEEHLARIGVSAVDGLVADVGLSSMQLDDAARGMSFRTEGPLDMRMDRSHGETALDLIDRLDDDELADVIYKYGEERRSRRVARCIKQARDAGELETTLDLRRAVVRAVGPARIGGVDPATRTFQALRIAVNGELDELEQLLAAAPRVIAPGGVIVVISFHSLEDRLVKRALRDRTLWRPTTKKPIVPTDEEMAENPRARSAKLRAAHRLAPEEVSVDDDAPASSVEGWEPGDEEAEA
jgi:16S rRNA (cytosine1402-N4)-methyltransferase